MFAWLLENMVPTSLTSKHLIIVRNQELGTMGVKRSQINPPIVDFVDHWLLWKLVTVLSCWLAIRPGLCYPRSKALSLIVSKGGCALVPVKLLRQLQIYNAPIENILSLLRTKLLENRKSIRKYWITCRILKRPEERNFFLYPLFWILITSNYRKQVWINCKCESLNVLL